MFDTIINKRTEYVPTAVNHHEHRAPTDKSVALLKEMEEAAQKKLISVTRLEDNLLKAEWYRFRSASSPRENIAIRILINDSEHVIDAELSYELQTEEDIAMFVYRKIADEMSGLLTTRIMTESRKTREL